MREIKVPRVTRKAFDKNRKASDLLRKQVAQLEHVVTMARGAGAMPLSASRVRTEGQVARFIAQATTALRGNAAAASPSPTVAPTAATSQPAAPGQPSSSGTATPASPRRDAASVRKKRTARKRKATKSAKKAAKKTAKRAHTRKTTAKRSRR